jgi:outer membrane protein
MKVRLLTPLLSSVFLLIPFTLSYGQTDSLTLDQVIAQAISNHPAVLRAQEDVFAAEARVGQNRSMEYPVVEGSAAYTRLDPAAQITFAGRDLKLVPNDNWDFHVGARHSLFDFGRKSTQVELSRSRVQTARDATETVRANLAYTVARAFYSILFLRRAIGVQDEEISALHRHLEVVRHKVAAGTALGYDTLITRVRIAAVENQRTDAENSLDKQLLVLRELLDLPTDAPMNIKGSLELVNVGLNEDSLWTAAQMQRTEIRLSGDAENSAKIQQRLAAVSDRPSLNAFVQYGLMNGYPMNLYALQGNWVGGAQVQIPLYNANRRRFLRQEADAALRAEQEHRQMIDRQIRAEISRAVADIRAALDKLETSKVQIQQAEEAMKLARLRYENGTITNMDLLDAETALTEAELVKEQALLSHVLACTALRQATGVHLWH